MMNAKSFAAPILFGIASAIPASAGEMVDLKCGNEACNYKAKLIIGGLRMSDRLVGYCTRDKEFVSLSWKRGEKGPDLIKVWNPKSGEMIDLFKCPKCSDPVLQVRDVKDLEHCPKCNQTTLEAKVVGNAD